MTARQATFVPFANEADVLQVGNLAIENRLDRITLNGDVDLTLDKAGLVKAGCCTSCWALCWPSWRRRRCPTGCRRRM